MNIEGTDHVYLATWATILAVARMNAAGHARIATLDRLAAGFFSQSMAHADAARKELLMSSHTRSAEVRGACHSDSCLGDAYLRQMREMSAIMATRPAPTQ